MADSTTTGSAIIGGINGGLQKGLLGAPNTNSEYTDKSLIIYGTPQNVITANVGSQVAFDIQNNDVYIAVTQGGSEWSRLGSLT